MQIIESVLKICRRLAPLGWAKLLDGHGLKLDRHSLASANRLKDELLRPLSIDRTVPGFEDFWPDGNSAIYAGRPSRSCCITRLRVPWFTRLLTGR
jgi:hypothetical protein